MHFIPKRRRVRPPPARPLPAPVKTGSWLRTAGSVYGRRSTVTYRLCCQPRLLAFAGVAALLGRVARGRRGAMHPPPLPV
jgi:hypothetical protein